MNKTTIKKQHKIKKNSLSYRKLRRWVLPAVLGAALSTLAVIPTLAAETQTSTNVAVVTSTEQTKTVPSAQGSTPPNGAPHGKPPAGQSPTGTSTKYLQMEILLLALLTVCLQWLCRMEPLMEWHHKLK